MPGKPQSTIYRWIPAFAGMLVICLLAASPAHAACTSPAGAAGDIVYNGTARLFQYCNDTNWVRMTLPGSGSGGCTNPAMNEGEIAYNTDQNMLQGCAGNVWRSITPAGGASIRYWKEFDVGGIHGCGIKFDGSLWCGGSDGWGQLGNGVDYETKQTPVPIAVGQTWKTLSLARTSSCAIRSDDTLWCWGNNYAGQLGVGDTDPREEPEQVSGGGTWKAVSTHGSSTCGIKTDDTLWCWGNDTNGRLGNGATGSTTAPGAVSGGGSWLDISTGDEFACGIKTDNSMYCWGRDNLGQLGNGAVTGDQQTPYQVTGTWKDVASGDYSACAIKSDDTLECWGSDTFGQLGNGATGSTTAPGAVSGGGAWKKVTVGYNVACGIKSDNTLYCWGNDSDGQLGNGAGGNSTAPGAVSGGGTWQAIRAGDRSVCGITIKGRLLCWGYNGDSQLGQGNIYSDFSAPQPVTGTDQWSFITVGDEHSCGIKADGTGWCMGTDSDSQLGNGSGVSGSQHYPYAMAGGGTWKSMSAGAYHSCGIKSDDTGWCWGANWGDGMIGNGTTSSAPQPASLNDGGATWLQISTGSFHACGIQTNGSAWCWGYGTSGEIGNGASSTQLSPVAVSGGYTWKKIDSGNSFACGIRSDDTAWCWGYGGNGELGDNAFTNSNVPVAVSGGHTWKEISAGGDHACAIRMDDTVWCWGDDTYGQLGNGSTTTTAQGAPVQISGGESWKFINARSGITCGIKQEGSGWCWGDDSGGELGNGPTVTANQDIPYQIHGGGSWTSISASSWGFSCGIVKSKAMCWGNPWSGSFGIGPVDTPGDIITPTSVICTAPEGRSGDIFYNADANALQFCDGAVWVKMIQ